MHKAFFFANPIAIKGLEAPVFSPQMMYLLTADVEQQGKAAILRQLARLFELDLEELLHPALDQAPQVLMSYDPEADEWEFLGERTDNDLLMRTYQLAKSMKTGEIDDEIQALLYQQGWSNAKDLKEAVDKMLTLITNYPFFWRAIKYQDQGWLRPYFEQAIPEHSSEERIITALTMDVQELAQYLTELGQHQQWWFAKYYKD